MAAHDAYYLKRRVCYQNPGPQYNRKIQFFFFEGASSAMLVITFAPDAPFAAEKFD
ncbi:MAG: hypothetical protein IJU44_00220 [Kiritimatiellae bacterium]|nr:hypothetical protein [Kiritimatiellia bacterium]